MITREQRIELALDVPHVPLPTPLFIGYDEGSEPVYDIEDARRRTGALRLGQKVI